MSDRWAIGAYRQQWIVYRRFEHRTRGGQWSPDSFVGSTRAILLRCLREKGAVATPEGQDALDHLALLALGLARPQQDAR